MPPRFDQGRSAPRKHPWVKVKPLESVFVMLVVPHSEIKGSPCHYVPGVGTVLCGRGDCAYCHLPEKYQWFAPCLQWIDPVGPFPINTSWGELKGDWVLRVLRITNHMEDLTLADHRHEIIKVYREGAYKNAPLHWTTVEVLPEARRLPLSAHAWEPLVMSCMAPRNAKKPKPPPPPAALPGSVSRGEVNVEPAPEKKPFKYSSVDFERIDYTKSIFMTADMLKSALSGDMGTHNFKLAEKFMEHLAHENGNGKK